MTVQKAIDREDRDKHDDTVEIISINRDYRFRHHILKCWGGDVHIWNLEKRRVDRGEEGWRFVANDRSPIRLGNYCAARGIMPDAENAELLSSLAFR